MLALARTFAAKQFERLSHRLPRHAGLFHQLGEIEVVFGFWAIVLILILFLVLVPLKQGFEDESISAGGLLLGALLPTAIAAAMFFL